VAQALRVLVLVGVACASGLSATRSSGQQRGAVALTSAGCEGAAAQLQHFVALELSPRLVVAGERAAAVTTRVRVVCLPGRAQLGVVDVPSGEHFHLEMALDPIAPAARPRALALAVSELVATSRLPRSAAREPARRTSSVALSSVSSVSSVSDGGHLWLAPGVSYLAYPSLLLPAVHVGGGYASHWFALHAEARFEYARPSVGDAGVELWSLSLALGPAWRFGDRAWRASLGPGLRLGYASMRGIASSPEQLESHVNGVWLGPCARAALAFDVARSWALLFGVELGYVARGVLGRGANREPLLELRGLWLAAQIGVRFDLAGADAGAGERAQR